MSESEKKSNKNASHHSISFTVGDEDVRRWLKLQENTSLSLRLILLNVIKQVGYMDYVTYLGLHTNVIPVNNAQNDNKPNVQDNVPAEKTTDTEKPVEKEVPKDDQINFMGLDTQAKEQLPDELDQ